MPWIIAGGAVLSGFLGSSASKKAASAQTDAAAQQIAEQRRQYDVTRADQTQFRDTGIAANERLRYLLGLSPGGTAGGTAGGTTSTGGATGGAVNVPTTYMAGQSGDPVWEELLGQFNQQHGAQYGIPMNRDWNADPQAQQAYSNLAEQYRNRKAAEQTQAQPAGAATAAAPVDPSDPYGLKADKFYASGLQFGLDQGTGAINARAIAGGGYDSGATLKALTRYANDYGSTKANDVYNRLAGVSGAGQTATNAIGTAGQHMADAVSGSIGSAGSARSAGIVGGANAWTGAGQQGFQNYNNMQTNQTLQKLLAQRGGSGYGGSYTTAPSSYWASNDPNNYMMGQN